MTFLACYYLWVKILKILRRVVILDEFFFLSIIRINGKNCFSVFFFLEKINGY